MQILLLNSKLGNENVFWKLYMKLIVKNEADWLLAKAYLESSKVLATDTETCPNPKVLGTSMENVGALRHDAVMLGVSFSKDEDSGIYIPFTIVATGESYLPEDLMVEIKSFLKGIFEDPEYKWIYHNCMFDIRVIGKNIAKPRSLLFDTQVAAHEIDENRQLGLKPLGVSLFNVDADKEKREMIAWCDQNNVKFNMGRLDLLPLDIYGAYAIQDTILTFKLFNYFKKQLHDKGLTKRFIHKMGMIPVYIELGSTGWCIDQKVLEDNSVKIEHEIRDTVNTMLKLWPKEIKEIEAERLDKGQEIKQSAAWLKLIIAKEGLEHHFTVPATGKTGKPLKDAGKFTTGAPYKKAFLASTEAQGTVTEEFIQWDTGNIADLSEQAEKMLRKIQRDEYIRKQTEQQKKDGKIILPFVFNPASNDQMKDLIFQRMGMTPTKFTKTAKAKTWEYADIGVEQLDRMKTQHQNYLDNNPGDPEEKKDKIQRRIDFFGALMNLRDKNKVYGTYLQGLQKILYTAEDLDRTPEHSCETGRELKYLISSINPTGTKTGRPSSSMPNLLNIPNNPLVKEAFVAPKGYKILSLDFAAQEVRQTAHVSKDPGLLEVFTVKCNKCGTPQDDVTRKRIALDPEKAIWWEDVQVEGETKKGPKPEICCPKCGAYDWPEPDPHSLTAQRVFPKETHGLDLAGIKKKFGATLRQDSKIIQFTILYGGSSYTLADRVYKSTDKATKEKAQGLIDNYFANNPALEAAIENTIDQARKTGYVETIGGYRRHLPDLTLSDFPAPKRPYLEDEFKSCYGKCDLDWDYTMQAHERESFLVCPKLDKESPRINCGHAGVCGMAFKSSNVKKLRARAERQAFNVKIQGDSADVTNKGLQNWLLYRRKRAKTEPIWDNIRTVGQIYDSVYAYVPEEIYYEAREKLLECMEDAYPDLYVKHQMDCEVAATNWSQVH